MILSKKFAGSLVLCAAPFLAVAADDPGDAFFNKVDAPLTPQDQAALAIAKKWQGNSATMKPVAGAEGSVQFVFGAQQISVVCAVLQICDIELQAGEQVNNLNVGDPRFQIEPAISGVGESEVQHLIVKPLDVGLETMLVVTTNRRTYHIQLKSQRNNYMARVTFSYADDLMQKWKSNVEKKKKERDGNTLPSGEYLGN